MFYQYRYRGTHRAPVTPPAGMPPTGRMLAALAAGGALAVTVALVVTALSSPVTSTPPVAAQPVTTATAPALPGPSAAGGRAGAPSVAVAPPTATVYTVPGLGVLTVPADPGPDLVHTGSDALVPVPLADLTPPPTRSTRSTSSHAAPTRAGS